MACNYHDRECRCGEPDNPIAVGEPLQDGDLIWVRHETRWRRCKVVRLVKAARPATAAQEYVRPVYLVQFLRPVNGAKLAPSRRMPIGAGDFLRLRPAEDVGAEWKDQR